MSRKLTFDEDTKETINVGSIPMDILDAYTQTVKRLKERNDEVKKLE